MKWLRWTCHIILNKLQEYLKCSVFLRMKADWNLYTKNSTRDVMLHCVSQSWVLNFCHTYHCNTGIEKLHIVRLPQCSIAFIWPKRYTVFRQINLPVLKRHSQHFLAEYSPQNRRKLVKMTQNSWKTCIISSWTPWTHQGVCHRTGSVYLAKYGISVV